MSPTALALLRLLAQGAPQVELDGVAALAPDDPDAGAAVALARRVSAAIDAHRRREAELAALVEVARDLASLDDPGTVLDAIVRQARALLGTDVAYLALADPQRGDTYMRATSGSVSARFQELRLPGGAGLGGLVAQTKRPYWTADYPADSRYRHTTEIDAAVDEEGLIAICGTPLLVDGEFVGVLFAANRTARPFSPDEVALLGSFAALAAVSLVQTRRAAQTAQALAALEEAHTAIQKAATAHDRFSRLVLGGGDVSELAAALGELLGCWVAVLDSDGQRIATHADAPPVPPGRDPLADSTAARRCATTGRLTSADGLWAAAVAAAGQRLGTIVLGGIDALDEGSGRTVERAAMVTALVLLFEMRAADAEQRVRTDLLAELLTRRGSDGPDRVLAERGRVLGLRLLAPHVVAVCRCATRPRGLLVAAARCEDGRGLAGDHDGVVVALLPGTDPSAVADGLARRLGEDGTEVTVGAAGPVVPARGLATGYAQARRICDAMVALGMTGRGGSVRELGFAGLVASPRGDVEAFLRQVLGPLLDYDERRGSALVATLHAYFATGASPRRAAARLHVHVNTVAQRLERVTALLGEGWQDPERALDVQLALRLHRLRDDGTD